MNQTAQRKPDIRVGKDLALDKPWSHEGEFLAAVMQAEYPNATRDVRLAALGSVNTIMPSEGGFAIPATVVQNAIAVDPIDHPALARVTEEPITEGLTLSTVVLDEASRQDGQRSGGFQYEPITEGEAYPYHIPRLRLCKLEANTFGAIIPATNKLVDYTPGFGASLLRVGMRECRMIEAVQIWNGNGVGQALGIRNANSLVVQAIEDTQTIANTATFIRTNAAKMFARVRNSARAVFYLTPTLMAAAIEAGVLSDVDADAPFGRLATRPVFPLEVAPAEGTVGDFVLADMSDYLLARLGVLDVKRSIHVKYITNESLFRFSTHFNGQPMLSGQVTPYAGSETISSYVALGARS